ncbi:hypothetical protein PYCC9005_002653 [Savitreella phatthalungensis]
MTGVPAKRSGSAISLASSKKVRFDALHPGTLAPDSRTPSSISRGQQTTSRSSATDSSDDDDDAITALAQADVATGAKRRKRVDLDGYHTDSSSEADDNDGTASGRPLATKGAIFGDDDGDEDGSDGDSRFLEPSEIDGQELGSRKDYMDVVDEDSEARLPDLDRAADRGRLDAVEERARIWGRGGDGWEDDDSEPDEEVGAMGRKHHAPRLDGFNMEAEMEEGGFDEEGNYVRKAKDEHDTQDIWLRDVSRTDIDAARAAHERRAQADAAHEHAQAQKGTPELLATVLDFLQPSETLLEALQRVGASTKRTIRSKRNKSSTTASVAVQGNDRDEHIKKQVQQVSQAASQLLTRMDLDIYDSEKELLMRAYRSLSGKAYEMKHEEEDVGAQENAGEKGGIYEFRWEGADEIHGPYEASEMQAWLEDGYFNDNQAYARRLTTEQTLDSDWQEIFLDTEFE